MADVQFPIAVLISGGGTTLQNLIQRKKRGQLPHVKIALVISSNPNAKGLQFAEEAGIPCVTVERNAYSDDQTYSQEVFAQCRQSDVKLVVMAGFLKFLPIPEDFENRVMNIHPGLIPAFCGKGMYGLRVHQAVLDYGAKISGCTIHFVDDVYDHGPIISQHVVPVLRGDTAETLQQRVFAVECDAYPAAIGLFASGRLEIAGRRIGVRSP